MNWRRPIVKRTEWVDRAKGLGILLVVLGHACVPSLVGISPLLRNIYLFIYMFHMPVFMYLSGYTFFHFSKRQSYVDFLIKKIKTLLFPYVGYILGIYLFFWCTSLIPALKNLLGVNVSFLCSDVIRDIIFCEGALDKHLWYIYLLFFISVVAYLIDKKVVLQSVLVVCALVGPVLFSKNLLPIYNLTYYLPIFFLGKVDVNSFINKMSKMAKCAFVVGYLCFEAIYLSNIQWFKGLGYGLAYIKYIAGYFGIFFFFICISMMKNKYFDSILQYMGRRSFPVYLFHQPIVVSGTALVSYKLFHSPIASVVISTLAGIITPIVIEIIYRKAKGYVEKNCKKLHL